MSQKLTGRDLILEGWQPGPIMGAALDVAEILAQDDSLERVEILDRLNKVRHAPFDFQDDLLYGQLVERLIELETPAPVSTTVPML